MNSLIKRILGHVYHRFIGGPAGEGKPVPEEFLNREYSSGAWDHFWKEDEEARHVMLVELIRERGPALSLLDLGCGSGRLASMLKSVELSDYLGVDLSEEGLAKARSLNPEKTFIHGNYEMWRPQRKYDVITFNECLGYAKVPARTIEIFNTFLNPGGCIIVSHFRFGNYKAVWRSLERVTTTVSLREAKNSKGQIWDLKVLIPKEQ